MATLPSPFKTTLESKIKTYFFLYILFNILTALKNVKKVPQKNASH